MNWCQASRPRLAVFALLVALTSQFSQLAHELEAHHDHGDEAECEICLVLDRTGGALIALPPSLEEDPYLTCQAHGAGTWPGDNRPATQSARGPPLS